MINSKARPHYEAALQNARNTQSGEVSEVFLNQATGMLEYGFLCRDVTSEAFELEMQRIRAIRANREARDRARG